MLFFLLVLVSVPIFCIDDDEFRKHYGLSFHNHCGDYVKSFKCMTTCKMMGFQIFRMNFKCKCSCHDMKTSTFLPFFKWNTNGTTKTIPKTKSAGLYDLVGFPKTTTEAPYTGVTCPTFYFPTWTMPASDVTSTDIGNTTSIASSNSTDVTDVATVSSGSSKPVEASSSVSADPPKKDP